MNIKKILNKISLILIPVLAAAVIGLLVFFQMNKENYVVVIAKNLSLRDAPSIDSEVLDLVSLPAILEIKVKSDSLAEYRNFYDYWYLVEYKGQQGYVFGHYVVTFSTKRCANLYLDRVFEELGVLTGKYSAEITGEENGYVFHGNININIKEDFSCEFIEEVLYRGISSSDSFFKKGSYSGHLRYVDEEIILDVGGKMKVVYNYPNRKREQAEQQINMKLVKVENRLVDHTTGIEFVREEL